MQSVKVIMAGLLVSAMAGCDIDKDAPKYDELRYEQLQKTRCVDMATMLSASFVNADPEDYDKSLKRCEDMKALSFEEYKRLSEHARATGSWDLYQLFPQDVVDVKQ